MVVTIDPKQRDAAYGSPLNVAKYLLDLNDDKVSSAEPCRVFRHTGSLLTSS